MVRPHHVDAERQGTEPAADDRVANEPFTHDFQPSCEPAPRVGQR